MPNPKFKATTTRLAQIPKMFFSVIPRELIAIILGYLSELHDLFSAIQTCRQLLYSYGEYMHQIITAIIKQVCAKDDFAIRRIFHELNFAIRHGFINRDHIQEPLLQQVWKLFQSLEIEELLFPLVEALAWTLCLDDREGVAVKLLRMIWDDKKRFSLSNIPL